jgi:hypothetical protein
LTTLGQIVEFSDLFRRNDRDANIRENIDRRPDRGEGAVDRNQDRHNHKRKGAPKRQSHDGFHGVALNGAACANRDCGLRFFSPPATFGYTAFRHSLL